MIIFIFNIIILNWSVLMMLNIADASMFFDETIYFYVLLFVRIHTCVLLVICPVCFHSISFFLLSYIF